MPRKQHSYHYIYKTTCKVTGRYYIGMHSTSNLDDAYLGSGKRLWYSIRKHGKENHVKEILEFLPDRIALKKREKEIVNEALLQDPLCMNLQLGGGGGAQEEKVQEKWWKSANEKRVEKIKNDPILRERFSTLMSIRLKKLWKEKKFDTKGEKNGFFNKMHSEEARKRIGEANSRAQSGERNSQFGTCWINNGVEAKKIKKEDLNEFLSSGWKIGRKITT